MKLFIGNQLIAKLKPDIKSYDVWDSKLTGFILRVLPSGTMVYRCVYARGKRISLGKVGILTPGQARDRAREILADVVKGNNPVSKRKKPYTLKEFIEKNMHLGGSLTANERMKISTAYRQDLNLILVKKF